MREMSQLTFDAFQMYRQSVSENISRIYNILYYTKVYQSICKAGFLIPILKSKIIRNVLDSALFLFISAWTNFFRLYGMATAALVPI